MDDLRGHELRGFFYLDDKRLQELLERMKKLNDDMNKTYYEIRDILEGYPTVRRPEDNTEK